MHLEIIWDTCNEYLIRDVSEKMIEEVKKVMFEKYFIPHRLFKHLKITEDPEAAVQYLNYLDFILQDECSVAVINQETNEIEAIALLKCMTDEFQSWTYLKFFIGESKFTDIIDLHYNMIFADEENPYDSKDCLYIFEIYIGNDLKSNEEIISRLFEAINDTARHLKMPRVACLALSHAGQELLTDFGYSSLTCALYSTYTYNNRRAFVALREIDEPEAVLFEMLVDPIVHFTEWRVRTEEIDIAPEVSARPSMLKKRLKSLQFGASN